MKNFIQEGEVLTLTAPYAVESGEGVLVGSIFGVATGKAALGEDVEAALCGVFQLKKASAAVFAQGDKVYWDNTAKQLVATASGNTHVGMAAKAGANGETSVAVKLLY